MSGMSLLPFFHSVSVWNGASFYFKIMSNSKEVASLKKELEALQKEIEGSKTPASQASIPLSNEDPSEGLSLGPSAVQSPEFGPGGTGASGSIANAAVPATEKQQDKLEKQDKDNSGGKDKISGGTPDTLKEIPSTLSVATTGDSDSALYIKRDQSIPSLKLDDYDAQTEGSQQDSNNDAMSDSSAVVVDAEDGQAGSAGQ